MVMDATQLEHEPRRRRQRRPADEGPAPMAPPKRGRKPSQAEARLVTGDDDEVQLPVDFAGVSIGDGTCRVGIRIPRGEMKLAKADQMLCGRRLTGRIVLTPNGESANQMYMFKDLKHEIRGTFDIKRYSVSPDWISCGLTFAMSEIDPRELASFAKRQGRLLVQGVTDIPTAKGGEDED